MRPLPLEGGELEAARNALAELAQEGVADALDYYRAALSGQLPEGGSAIRLLQLLGPPASLEDAPLDLIRATVRLTPF